MKCLSCIPTFLSIPSLTPTTFPPLGGLSLTLASCFVVFCLVHRSPLQTYWKLTELFLYTLCSSQLPSLILVKTVSPSTPHCAFAPHLSTAKFTEWGQTSCVHMELGLSQDGLMTICSLAYLIITLGNTMSVVSNGLRTLLTGVGTNMEVVFGLVVTPSTMALSRNLMKTVISYVWIYLDVPCAPLKTSTFPKTLMALTKCPSD